MCVFCIKIYVNSVHNENNTIKTMSQGHREKWLCCTISLHTHSTAMAQLFDSVQVGNVLKLNLKN